MARVLRNDVHIETSPGVYKVLKAGEAVPTEFAERVTNPSAYVEVEGAVHAAPSAPAAASADTGKPKEKSEGEPVNYTKLKKDELVALAGQRGLDATGNVKVLAERLAAQDAEEAAKGTGDQSEVDLDTLDEAGLRAYALEHSIEVDAGLTREEVLAVIENEQQGA